MAAYPLRRKLGATRTEPAGRGAPYRAAAARAQPSLPSSVARPPARPAPLGPARLCPAPLGSPPAAPPRSFMAKNRRERQRSEPGAELRAPGPAHSLIWKRSRVFKSGGLFVSGNGQHMSEIYYTEPGVYIASIFVCAHFRSI